MPADRKTLDLIGKAEDEGDTAFVRFLCERALELDPDDGLTLIRYANTLRAFSLYDKAIEVLQRAEEVVPDRIKHLVFAQRGHLFKDMGDCSAAENQYLVAHKLDPEDASYLTYAGSAAFQRGDIEQGLSYACDAIKCPEGCIDEAFFNLGGYLLAQQRYEEAGVMYRRALEIDPDYEVAKKRLADVERILNFENCEQAGD